MDPDDTDEHRVDDGDEQPRERDETVVDGDGLRDTAGEDEDGVRTAAAEEVDQRIVDLLSWILDTETRAKIYVHLLANPGSTSEEVAKGTGLYPSTVREALAELHEEERVIRQKRASEGAGNNPYEYTAIQPSELVGGVVDQVQQELNTIFTLDRVLDRTADQSGTDSDADLEDGAEPVTITVDESGPFTGDSGDRTDDGDTGPTADSTTEATSETDIEIVDEGDKIDEDRRVDEDTGRDGTDENPNGQ